MSFNFDEWADLYKTNRPEFERRRMEVTRAEIAKAPAGIQPQLRALQTQCDAIHATMPGLTGARRMTQLMHESVLELQDAWYDLALVVKPI